MFPFLLSYFFAAVLFIFVIGFTVTFFVYNAREPQYAGDEEVTSKLMDEQILDVFQLGMFFICKFRAFRFLHLLIILS
jgi:hypothetical protein